MRIDVKETPCGPKFIPLKRKVETEVERFLIISNHFFIFILFYFSFNVMSEFVCLSKRLSFLGRCQIRKLRRLIRKLKRLIRKPGRLIRKLRRLSRKLCVGNYESETWNGKLRKPRRRLRKLGVGNFVSETKPADSETAKRNYDSETQGGGFGIFTRKLGDSERLLLLLPVCQEPLAYLP